MADKNYFVYGGSYSSLAEAQADFDAVKTFHSDHTIGSYEEAIFTKGADGKVDIVNTRTPRRSHGAEWGVATGALIGVLFPVTFLIGTPLLTGAAGGAILANWSKSFGRDDIRKMGEALDQGQSGVVVVAEVNGDLPVEKLLSRALSTTMAPIPDAKAVHDHLDENA